jgi:hypothetical protein
MRVSIPFLLFSAVLFIPLYSLSEALTKKNYFEKGLFIVLKDYVIITGVVGDA